MTLFETGVSGTLITLTIVLSIHLTLLWCRCFLYRREKTPSHFRKQQDGGGQSSGGRMLKFRSQQMQDTQSVTGQEDGE